MKPVLSETLQFIYIFGLQRLFRSASFIPFFDRPNSVGEVNYFLRRVLLQNGNSLLTGAESRVTLKTPKCVSGHNCKL